MKRRTRKRQAKRLMLTLLLSVALLSMNMNFVYAEEMGLADNNSVSAEAPSDADTSSESGQTGNDATEQTGNEADVTDSGAAESESAEGNSAAVEGSTESEAGGNSENAGTENGSASGTAADEPEETAEKVYINQSGEEVLPSTLIGLDYNTIADNYDGAADTLKQYVVSDEYEKDTIINSYVDENGNLVMIICQGAAGADAETETEEKGPVESFVSAIADALKLEAESGSSSDAPAVDGSFTGWDDIPASYEFNWNKPDAWVDGVHYTETNSTDVRHEMKLYSDGENVYLKVVFARELSTGQIANGNDYQFWIDDKQMAAYQVEWPNGSSLSYNTAEPGVYVVDVRHRDSDDSYVLTDGAVAYYRINEGNLNNELELKIPLSEFVTQNPNIDLDNYSKIGFITPNLMLNRIYTGGASTGAEPFAAAVFLLVPASYVWLKRKDDKEDMAFA